MARVLIVEDEYIVQLDLESLVEHSGHSVAGLASTGEEAVAMALDSKPDLVLMDVHLGGDIDGIEAARQITVRNGTTIIFVTAYAGLLGEGESRQMPGPCLSKPLNVSQLRAAIDEALKTHHAPSSDLEG
jgi:CheY-like chemotaxis protein